MTTGSPLRLDPPEFVGSAELVSSMTEHVVVFPVSIGSDRWWLWCPISLSGMGVDITRRRWSRPYGALIAPADEPEISVRGLTSREEPLFSYDAPIVVDQ